MCVVIDEYPEVLWRFAIIVLHSHMDGRNEYPGPIRHRL